jgi:hypothetical protein
MQDPMRTLRGRGMRATKVLACLLGATALAVCAWGMSTTDPGVVNGAFGVVTQVRVRTPWQRVLRLCSQAMWHRGMFNTSLCRCYSKASQMAMLSLS